MSANRTYRITLKWQDRKWGPQLEKLVAEGTSIRRAIANALLGFFSNKSNREARRGAHTELTVSATRIQLPAVQDRPARKRAAASATNQTR